MCAKQNYLDYGYKCGDAASQFEFILTGNSRAAGGELRARAKSFSPKTQSMDAARSLGGSRSSYCATRARSRISSITAVLASA